MTENQIENALQRAAPVLPTALETQVLRRCRLAAEARERKYRRTQRTLWGAVFAVCALHWLVVGQLDAQSARWVNGDNPPAPTLVRNDESHAPSLLMAFGWQERKFALSGLINEPNGMAR